MTRGLSSLIKKDIREVIRTGKVITFVLVAFGIALMILMFTFLFSDIPEVMWEQLSAFNISSLEEVMASMYPKSVRESTGIFAYYIGFFFSLVVILMTHNILPKERKQGKWIIPLQQGYEGFDIILAKCIVYGAMTGLVVFGSYMFYYILANVYMERNFPFGNAIVCGVVHGFNLCFIVIYTMIFSLIWKNPVIAAVSMLATVILVPDIAIYFAFGKFLPTYPLTFVYDSSSEYGNLVAPFIINLGIMVILYMLRDLYTVRRDEQAGWI